MKPKYYTLKNIDQRAKEYLENLSYFRQAREVNIKKDKPALLVVDMQKYFLDNNSHAEIPSAPAIVPNIKKLQNCFLDNGHRVIQTRHINNKKNAGMMDKWWADVITEKDPMSQPIDELKDERIEILKKSQYDAFYNTGLAEKLKSKGIEQIVLTGVATHLCCETTARTAFVNGFEVFFVIDAVATYWEDFHVATLLNLSHGFAIPVLTEEILTALEKS